VQTEMLPDLFGATTPTPSGYGPAFRQTFCHNIAQYQLRKIFDRNLSTLWLYHVVPI